MTVGGVYIPDPMNGELQEGAVETIGPGAHEAEKGGKEKEEGKKRIIISKVVNPGDHVINERYAGQAL